jgi:hypothetical protein
MAFFTHVPLSPRGEIYVVQTADPDHLSLGAGLTNS